LMARALKGDARSFTTLINIMSRAYGFEETERGRATARRHRARTDRRHCSSPSGKSSAVAATERTSSRSRSAG
jgi:hypothetical protein